jgi:hypothetical protein
LIQLLLNIREVFRKYFSTGKSYSVVSVNALIKFRKQVRVLVTLATDHDSIHSRKMFFHLIQATDPTVDYDFEFWIILLELENPTIPERGNFSVILR